MNGSAHMNHPARRFNSPGQWLRLCGLLCLLLARPALATDALWPPADQLGQVFNYTVPGNPPPMIDATAFDNENQFTINFTAATANPEIFETWNTVNYTNNGLMVANSAVSTTGIIFLIAPGCGFLFDTQTTNVIPRKMAGTFYNPGTIRCASINDSGFIFGVGEFIVSATNIVNSGTVDVGMDGLMQFTGQNVDLSRSTLNMEGGGANVAGTGVIGLNTNYWDPSAFLGPNFAESAFFPIAPFYLFLPNSTAYFDFASTATNNNIIRAVFIQDTSVSNVSYNVYFDSAGLGFGGGNATVEWVGSYQDAASGNSFSNYLYLNDNYILGASTNVSLFAGYPANFTFTASSTPQFTGIIPAPAGFFNVFPAGTITNRYAFANVQVISTTVSTNISSNPSHSITNLPGRIQISGSKELDMSFAKVTGPNYMSVQSTNQFDGSAGALIQTPYSDINIGVTNGFLTVSNLMEASIPNWSGNVQAWSTRWLALATNSSIVVDTNGVATTNSFTVTNDFRVEIVASQLTPTTLAQVQDLILHGTNSIVISDAFNVMRTFTADAQNLTLTTNGAGVGATSLDGELNWSSTTTFGPTQLPNLRNLTNNGAIRAANLAVFGSSSASYGAFINNGLLADQGSTIYANNFLNSGTISNGVGSFTLRSLTTILTNGSITAGGDISITASSLVTSNLVLQAGRSLTLQATNLLTDGVTNGTSGLTNGNIWSVGAASIGAGLNLPIKPALGDLLGTTITNIAPTNKNVINIWAGVDRGSSNSGYTNNAAVGRLILDALGASPGTQFYFSGTGASNAIYVDYLELQDRATNRDVNGNVSALEFRTNLFPNLLVIYYAQAVINGSSVAEKLNHKNSNHLRWVPTYAGYFSSTNIVNPDGTTNTVNAALAQSTTIDSDGDGIVNANDPTPFFVSGNVNFTATLTNVPPLKVRLQWQTIPDATNYVFYKTNLLAANWLVLTNFITPPAPPYAPITTNVLDSVNPAVQKYYRVRVDPNSTDFNGP